MLKKILRFTSVLILGLSLSLFYSGAYAQEHGNGENRGENRRDNGAQVTRDTPREGRGGSHYYRNGRWYTHGWFGWETPVSVLPAGVMVDSVPQTYTVVVVSGNTYYYGDNTYFRQLPQGGYAVVSVPLRK